MAHYNKGITMPNFSDSYNNEPKNAEFASNTMPNANGDKNSSACPEMGLIFDHNELEGTHDFKNMTLEDAKNNVFCR